MKKSTRTGVTVSALLGSWLVIACGAPTSPSDPGGEAAGSLAQASSKSTCRQIVLQAEKDYGPASWKDGTASASPAMRFDLPEVIPVTAGSAGHGSATLTLRNGSQVTVCTYRGDDDDCDRRGSRGRSRYTRSRCDRRVGEDVTATAVTLHVDDGDSHDSAHRTAVEIRLNEEDCRPAGPDAGPPPPPPDAGPPPPPPDAGPPPPPPDAGPACDAAACDDGNPCTTDACGATGGCVHAPVADGTSCFDGNLCIFSNSETCQAGACTTGVPDCGGAECVSSACDSATGQCMPAPAGTPCSGGTCDGSFGCIAGAAATNVTYIAPLCPPQTNNDCTSRTGTYVASSNGCVYPSLAGGTPCANGVCDGADQCVDASSPTDAGPGAGLFLGAACPFSGECTQAGAIDFAVSMCAYVDLPAGTACSGGRTCNGSGVCGP